MSDAEREIWREGFENGSSGPDFGPVPYCKDTDKIRYQLFVEGFWDGHYGVCSPDDFPG